MVLRPLPSLAVVTISLSTQGMQNTLFQYSCFSSARCRTRGCWGNENSSARGWSVGAAPRRGSRRETRTRGVRPGGPMNAPAGRRSSTACSCTSSRDACCTGSRSRSTPARVRGRTGRSTSPQTQPPPRGFPCPRATPERPPRDGRPPRRRRPAWRRRASRSPATPRGVRGASSGCATVCDFRCVRETG